MSNVAAIIKNHNTKILAPAPEQAPRTCNCRRPENCPLNGHCLTECLVYKATVSAPNKPNRHYYGLTEGPFKTRFTAHSRSFRNSNFRRKTELSKYIWDLKDQDVSFEVTWSIAQRASPYKCGTRQCDVCLTEKAVIATADLITTLNKRSEIVSTCRHRAKFRYSRLTDYPP